MRDCAYERLKLLEAKGYKTVFIWLDPAPHGSKEQIARDTEDNICLSQSAAESVVKFTNGKVPVM